jgi:integrase
VTPALKPREVSFGAFAARHVASLTGVGPGYRTRFAREMVLHFAPFSDQPIRGITDLAAREWIRGMEDGAHPWLRRGPSSPTTIRRLLTQAGAVMAAAQAEGLADRNPFRGHRVGRRDRDQHTEMVVLTQEEAAVLLEAIPAGTYRDLVTVLLGTGMRWGEVTALGPGHVDPFATPPVLHVARAWQDNGHGGYQLGTPKSRRSRRTIDFTSAVLDALVPHLASAQEFVFTTPSGAPLRHSNFYHRVWQPALDRAGLAKRPRIHDLRHSHASWLIAGGMDVAAVSRRLGHETTALTSDTYYHVMPKTRSDALRILDIALPSPPGPTPGAP